MRETERYQGTLVRISTYDFLAIAGLDLQYYGLQGKLGGGGGNLE